MLASQDSGSNHRGVHKMRLELERVPCQQMLTGMMKMELQKVEPSVVEFDKATGFCVNSNGMAVVHDF